MMRHDQFAEMLRSVTDAHASITQPLDTLSAMDRAIEISVGRKVLTVLIVHAERGIVERVFSNVHASYTAGGRKRIDSAPRLQTVLATRQPFIGRNKDEILANFTDAQEILATGCSSIMNVPVLWKGSVVATVNLLHTENYFQSEHIPIVQCLAQAALPALLSI
ncbi:GAF domain-containing protein [Burkholderia cepacia]|uniref:GAF domain-containing protein n=1 Tax=Burkholderia cepacia TaxID=292 RepID=UPI0012D9AAC6|nr:GAF domain-containing protein [Burkholderia cepacia]MCA8119075.1 GAF domain-containing protein [Burkholderia cepacia]